MLGALKNALNTVGGKVSTISYMSGSMGLVTSISTKPLRPINHTNAPTTKVETMVPKTANKPMVQKLAKKSFFFNE